MTQNTPGKKTKQEARSLRKRQTRGEKILWEALRNRRFEGLKFRRQHPIGPYIVDFYCHTKKLIIEIDGDPHVYKLERDSKRQRWLEAQRFTVIRFQDRAVIDHTDAVLEGILHMCRGIP